VGFSTEQAKKSVQVWMELMDQNFATKADFKEHYFMTRTDMVELRSELKNRCDDIDKRCDIIESKFDKLETKLIIKLGIMMASSIGIVSAIVSFKPRFRAANRKQQLRVRLACGGPIIAGRYDCSHRELISASRPIGVVIAPIANWHGFRCNCSADKKLVLVSITY